MIVNKYQIDKNIVIAKNDSTIPTATDVIQQLFTYLI